VLALVLAESGVLAIVGGGLGLALGAMGVGAGDPTGGFLQVFFIPRRDAVAGVVFVLLLGLLAGVLPALRRAPARNRRIAEGLTVASCRTGSRDRRGARHPCTIPGSEARRSPPSSASPA
jgi:hypothetical protein